MLKFLSAQLATSLKMMDCADFPAPNVFMEMSDAAPIYLDGPPSLLNHYDVQKKKDCDNAKHLFQAYKGTAYTAFIKEVYPVFEVEIALGIAAASHNAVSLPLGTKSIFWTFSGDSASTSGLIDPNIGSGILLSNFKTSLNAYISTTRANFLRSFDSFLFSGSACPNFGFQKGNTENKMDFNKALAKIVLNRDTLPLFNRVENVSPCPQIHASFWHSI
jgi:hypothetical protein